MTPPLSPIRSVETGGWTPGPWDWEATVQFGDTFSGHVYLTDSTGRKIASLWGRGEEKIANAHLVSSAPLLAEELDRAVHFLELVMKDTGWSAADEAVEDFRAALAKARGQ